MGKKTIFDMGKNLCNSSLDIPCFEAPKLDPDIISSMDYAKDAMDAMAYAMYVATGTGYMRAAWDSDPKNPQNARYEGPGSKIHYNPSTGMGPIIDLKPEDYQVVEERKQLQGASDVATRGPNHQHSGASGGNSNESGENRD